MKIWKPKANLDVGTGASSQNVLTQNVTNPRDASDGVAEDWTLARRTKARQNQNAGNPPVLPFTNGFGVLEVVLDPLITLDRGP